MKSPPSSTQDLITLAEDGRRLMQYVARHGDLTVSHEIAKGITTTSTKIDNNSWNVSDEIQLIHCYDLLARQVYPVTIESIKAVIPDSTNGKLSSPSAAKTINWYRHCTVFTLLCLLAMQMFYLFGHTLVQSLDSVAVPITTPLPAEINAKYLLLQQWNQIWMLGQIKKNDKNSMTM